MRELREGVGRYAGGVGYVVEYPFRWTELVERAVEVRGELDAVDGV